MLSYLSSSQKGPVKEKNSASAARASKNSKVSNATRLCLESCQDHPRRDLRVIGEKINYGIIEKYD